MNVSNVGNRLVGFAKSTFLTNGFFDVMKGDEEGRYMASDSMYGGLDKVTTEFLTGVFQMFMHAAVFSSGIALLSAFIAFQLYAHDIIGTPGKAVIAKQRLITIMVTSVAIFSITGLIDLVIVIASSL